MHKAFAIALSLLGVFLFVDTGSWGFAEIAARFHMGPAFRDAGSWLSMLGALFVANHLVGPAFVRFKLHPIEQPLHVFDPQRHRPPDAALRHFEHVSEVLRSEGFGLLVSFVVESAPQHSYWQIFESSDGRTVAQATWSVVGAAVVLRTRIAGGRTRATAGGRGGSVGFPGPAWETLHVFPGLDPKTVVLVHRAELAGDAPAETLYRTGDEVARFDPLGWMRRDEARRLEALVDHGVIERTPDGRSYRNTWAWAFQAIWNMAWPGNVLLLRKRHARASARLRELRLSLQLPPVAAHDATGLGRVVGVASAAAAFVVLVTGVAAVVSKLASALTG